MPQDIQVTQHTRRAGSWVTATLSGVDGLPLNISSDAFQRLAVSSPETILEAKQVNADSPMLMASQGLSGGTVTWQAEHASVALEVPATDGASAIRQTRQRANYQPGKSLLSLISFCQTQCGVTGATFRVGLFDEQNGYFYMRRDGVSYIVRRAGGADLEIPQSEWNTDTMDGSAASVSASDATLQGINKSRRNPSTLEFDPGKSQIVFGRQEWLGVGDLAVGFVINGRFVTAHIFHHANISSSVYFAQPNNPIRWELTSQGSACSARGICGTVLSEGGQNDIGVYTGVSTPSPVAVDTILRPVISVRLKPGSKQLVTPILADIVSIGNQNVEYVVIYRASLPGTPVWTNVNGSSCLQADISASGAITYPDPAHPLIKGWVLGKGTATTAAQNWYLGAGVDGTPDVLTLAARTISASDSLLVSAQFLERM